MNINIGLPRSSAEAALDADDTVTYIFPISLKEVEDVVDKVVPIVIKGENVQVKIYGAEPIRGILIDALDERMHTELAALGFPEEQVDFKNA